MSHRDETRQATRRPTGSLEARKGLLMDILGTPKALPPLQLARIRVVDAMEHLDRVFSHSSYPEAVRIAAQAVNRAVEEWAELRREAPRSVTVPQPSDGRNMVAAGYTRIDCQACLGQGRVEDFTIGQLHPNTITCGRCHGYGHLFTRERAA